MASTYLGVDFGQRRVGIAVGDSDARLALPLKTLANDDSLMERIQSLATEHHARSVVVGLPRNLDGEETNQSRIVRQFSKDLSMATGLAVELQDEALTSEAVINRLHPTKQQVDDGLVDREAAAMILQDYLDVL